MISVGNAYKYGVFGTYFSFLQKYSRERDNDNFEKFEFPIDYHRKRRY